MSATPRVFDRTRQTLGAGTFYLLIGLFTLRLISLAAYPLMDTTEGRYGEIARRMVALDDWITPFIADGVPFWGKPPLAFWLSAVGIEVLGVNEFAVRVPHFLTAVATVALVFDWAQRAGMRRPAYVLPLLAGTFLFIVASGAVMTDTALCFGTTLSMRSFWLALKGPVERRNTEGWLFFFGLTVTLLAKGPVGWVLVLAPVGMWTLWTRNFGSVRRALPWARGTLLAIGLAAPWYALAEARTPGFLEYFVIGEHWRRFTEAGWQGDRYGSAHAFPHGSIWLFLVASCLPWSVILPVAAVLGHRPRSSAPSVDTAAARKFELYLLMCGLAPCLFFTVAGNILWTYVLPALPPLAVWSAAWLHNHDERLVRTTLAIGMFASAVAVVAGLTALTWGGVADAMSARAVVRLYRDQQRPEIPLAFVEHRMFSAAFYSAGTALQITDLTQIPHQYLECPLFIAVPRASLKESLQLATKDLQFVGDAPRYRLFLRPTSGSVGAKSCARYSPS